MYLFHSENTIVSKHVVVYTWQTDGVVLSSCTAVDREWISSRGLAAFWVLCQNVALDNMVISVCHRGFRWKSCRSQTNFKKSLNESGNASRKQFIFQFRHFPDELIVCFNTECSVFKPKRRMVNHVSEPPQQTQTETRYICQAQEKRANVSHHWFWIYSSLVEKTEMFDLIG